MANTMMEPKTTEQRIEAMENIGRTAGFAACRAVGQVQQALTIARAARGLCDMITTEMLEDVMSLQNKSYGFKTDLETGYAVKVVREVFIEAILRGVRMVGNEVNIIAGNLYVAKAGFARLVREFPGVEQFVSTPGVPKVVGAGGALVPYRACWLLDGEQQSAQFYEGPPDERIAVRVNKGMGIDAILGKAERKMLARVFAQLSGHHLMPEGEVDQSNQHDLEFAGDVILPDDSYHQA